VFELRKGVGRKENGMKTCRIGIIGAENSHTAAIARTLNIERAIKGFSVDFLWGETDEFARDAAGKGRIPNIVKRPREMLGEIDALIVDHRHAKYHLRAALPFVEKGIPTFVDKPFCYRAAEGREFLRIARKRGTRVTSFSTIPLSRSFAAFVRKTREAGDILGGATYGPCDIRSTYGGVFFYGIHQVAMALDAFGTNISHVQLSRNRGHAVGQLHYTDGKIVTMHLVKSGWYGFVATAIGSERRVHREIRTDANPYLTGVRMFTTMFRTGVEPIPHTRILRSVEVLEALQQSQKSGERERVG